MMQRYSIRTTIRTTLLELTKAGEWAKAYHKKKCFSRNYVFITTQFITSEFEQLRNKNYFVINLELEGNG